MSEALFMSIPYTFENKVLHIKSLGLEGKGDSAEEAFRKCIDNTSLYSVLSLAVFKSYSTFRGSYSHIEVPYHASILKLINQLEPYPEDKKNKKGFLFEPSPEDILKLGY